MKFLFFSLLLAAVPLWSYAESSVPESSPAASLQEPVFHWNKSCNDNGLTIYWSKVEGSQVIAFRGEGIIDAPLEKVASIIIDTTRATEWVDSLVSSKVVRNVSPVEFIEYDHAGIPFPFTAVMSDRDFVSCVTVESDPKTRRLTVNYNPAEDSLAPPIKKCVRGVMTCVFKMVPMTLDDETYVEAEVHCDPKGGVPKWLVNFFQQGWPQTTFENLRRQVKKPNIEVLPVVESLLRKTPVKLVQNNKK
jgi:hypothetical protein